MRRSYSRAVGNAVGAALAPLRAAAERGGRDAVPRLGAAAPLPSPVERGASSDEKSTSRTNSSFFRESNM